MLFIQWVINPRHRSAALYFVAFCWMAFLISNLDFGINLYLMIKGFWYSLPQGGPDVFFEDPQNWQTVLREITSQLLVTTGDSLMVMLSLVIPITLTLLIPSSDLSPIPHLEPQHLHYHHPHHPSHRRNR